MTGLWEGLGRRRGLSEGVRVVRFRYFMGYRPSGVVGLERVSTGWMWVPFEEMGYSGTGPVSGRQSGCECKTSSLSMLYPVLFGILELVYAS